MPHRAVSAVTKMILGKDAWEEFLGVTNKHLITNY